MFNFFISLSLTFLISLPSAFADLPKDKVILVPEEEAHYVFGIGQDRELQRKSLRALIWNIKKAELDDWQKEFHFLSKDRDLILIQEAYGSRRFMSAIERVFHFRWDLGISFLFDYKIIIPTGTMIGSSVVPSEVFVRHSPDFEPIISTPKAITFARYPVKGKNVELLVVSVHAINFVKTDAFKRHVDRALEEIKTHRGPVLFAGDFNTWNRARTSYLFSECEKLGLQEVSFKNGDRRTTFGKYILDHGFVRGLEVIRAEIVIDSNGSDHLPMTIDFNVL